MKTLKLIIISISIILILTTNLFSFDKYPPDINKILKRGEIIVALYYKDIFPFFFHDKNGNLTGYDIDLAKDIAKKFGVKVTFNRESKTFNQIIDLVNSQKVDMAISIISITLKRSEKVLFSKPYLILHPVIMLNRLSFNSGNIKSLYDQKYKIGEKKGTSYIDFAKRIFKNSSIIKYTTWNEAIRDLLKGKISAILRDEIGVNNFLMKNPSASIKIKTITLKNFNDNIAIAIPPTSRQLKFWLDLYISTIKRETNPEKIISKYYLYLKKD